VLVAVIPLLRSGSQVTTASSKPTTTRQLGPGTLSHLPILPQDWIEAPDPYEGLAKGTGQNLAAVMLYVPGIAGTKGIIDAETEASEGEPSWADQMSEGLKPVSDSVAETINLILESLPVNQLASRS
jgi:hypothetical protein